MIDVMDFDRTAPTQGDGPVGHRTYKGPESLAAFNDARLCRIELEGSSPAIKCGRDRGHTGRHECRVSWGE